MKHVKFLGLLAVAAAALMAFAGVASAGTVTSPAGTLYTGEIEAKSEGHLTFHGPSGSGIKLECTASLKGAVESHGSGVTPKVKLASVTWSNCTNGWHDTTVTAGTLETHVTATNLATVTSSGMTVSQTNAALGLTCNYLTSNTDIGTLTGGTPATLDIAATIPVEPAGSSIFCGSSSVWTGNVMVTSPVSLHLDV